MLSLLPRRFFYLLSDICAFFLNLVGYRRSVIDVNMARSFPQAGYGEIKKWRREYYKYMMDITFESIWAISASQKEICEVVSVPDRFETTMQMQDCQENLYGWKVAVDGKEASSVGVKAEIKTGDAGLMVHEGWSIPDETKTNVYEGQFFVTIYDDGKPMDYCNMTFRPGSTTTYRASR